MEHERFSPLKASFISQRTVLWASVPIWQRVGWVAMETVSGGPISKQTHGPIELEWSA